MLFVFGMVKDDRKEMVISHSFCLNQLQNACQSCWQLRSEKIGTFTQTPLIMTMRAVSEEDGKSELQRQ